MKTRLLRRNLEHTPRIQAQRNEPGDEGHVERLVRVGERNIEENVSGRLGDSQLLLARRRPLEASRARGLSGLFARAHRGDEFRDRRLLSLSQMVSPGELVCRWWLRWRFDDPERLCGHVFTKES